MDPDNNGFYSFLGYEYNLALPLEIAAVAADRKDKKGVKLEKTLEGWALSHFWTRAYHMPWGKDREVANSCICLQTLAAGEGNVNTSGTTTIKAQMEAWR